MSKLGSGEARSWATRWAMGKGTTWAAQEGAGPWAGRKGEEGLIHFSIYFLFIYILNLVWISDSKFEYKHAS
jgi:hypothetical protein